MIKRFAYSLAGVVAISSALVESPAGGGLMQIRIDAGANPAPAASWNVLGEYDAGNAVPLTDTTGAATGVTATLATNQSAVWWRNTTAGGLGDEGYSNTPLADGTDWGMYLANKSGYTIPMSGTVEFDGLQPESWQWYRIEISASRAASAWGKTQDVTVNGAWADGDHTGQGFKADTHGYGQGILLRWDDVLPDANGLITVTVTRAGAGGTHDAYLNALIITLVPEPSTALLLALAGLSLALPRPRRPRLRSEM
ncbi:MAG: hypothetical protein RBS80_27500 [Thermoguttaceae bacterium]|jgi:hypothetical protein|nr:hypothetical protein [Thermoguttaceae bacterium]